MELFGLVERGAGGTRLDEIHCDPDMGFTVYGNEPKAAGIFLGFGDMEDKFDRLAKLRKTLEQRKQYAASVDLSYSDRVVARLMPLEEEEKKK